MNISALSSFSFFPPLLSLDSSVHFQSFYGFSFLLFIITSSSFSSLIRTLHFFYYYEYHTLTSYVLRGLLCFRTPLLPMLCAFPQQFNFWRLHSVAQGMGKWRIRIKHFNRDKYHIHFNRDKYHIVLLVYICYYFTTIGVVCGWTNK